MIEYPESLVLARQLNETVINKKIIKVTANQNPHKLAWFSGEPEKYKSMLENKKIGKTSAFGGKVEIAAEDMRIVFSEGINLRYIDDGELPQKHQLLLEFDDGTYLAAYVQMYGGMWAFTEGTFDNEYYLAAKEAVDPLSDKFCMKFFKDFMNKDGMGKLSAKAFLATEQRFPGLGNGVLQDILYHAKIHPKRKIATMSEDERAHLFLSVKLTLKDMAELGGRDTEKDLFGNFGGYKTHMSKNTVGASCTECGGTVTKSSYMGGSVYFCDGCQKE